MNGSMVGEMMRYRPHEGVAQTENSLREVVQEIVLYGLGAGGFFRDAALCGGAALRHFHGLDRYS